MTQFILYFALLVGMGLPTVYSISVGSNYILLVPLILGFGWIASYKFRCVWGYNLVFLIGITTLGIAGFFFLSPVIASLSAIFLLAAWDLTNFQNLLNRFSSTKRLSEVERTHLWRLFIFMLLALSFTLGPVVMRIQITFLQAVTLLIISFIGLMQLVRWLSNQQSAP